MAGTGLINGKFTFDARLSKINSDGFIDRADSKLKSWFVSGGLYTNKTILKLNLFSGFEETYQAWWGIPSVRLNNDLAGMQRYEEHGLYTPEQTRQMISSGSRTYNYYTYLNQIDRYQQDHYHLHFSHRLKSELTVNCSAFYIKGAGYYENFETDQDFADYRIAYPVINGTTIKTTDLINRKWLNNNFYGTIFSVNYSHGKGDLSAGGGLTLYDGLHTGRVIWAEFMTDNDNNHLWYSGTGLKKDANVFAKYTYRISQKINLYAEGQYRHINYTLGGIDDKLRDIGQKHVFDFLNPRAGLNYQPTDNQSLYVSFGTGHREPNRSNYTDADPKGKIPVPETLKDLEIGYNLRNSGFQSAVNFFYMNYRNQLVLTGEINDVGAPVMENVDKSFRTGIEWQGGFLINRNLQWNFNVTASSNKIKNFTEHIDNWDTGEQVSTFLGTTHLSFSPSFTANSVITFKPIKSLDINLVSNYVGKQFIDNSSGTDRVLDPYFVSNLEGEYTTKTKLFNTIKFTLALINLQNAKYESNAWVYSYIYNGERFKMDGYFPQAGFHFMTGIEFSF